MLCVVEELPGKDGSLHEAEPHVPPGLVSTFWGGYIAEGASIALSCGSYRQQQIYSWCLTVLLSWKMSLLKHSKLDYVAALLKTAAKHSIDLFRGTSACKHEAACALHSSWPCMVCPKR